MTPPAVGACRPWAGCLPIAAVAGGRWGGRSPGLSSTGRSCPDSLPSTAWPQRLSRCRKRRARPRRRGPRGRWTRQSWSRSESTKSAGPWRVEGMEQICSQSLCIKWIFQWKICRRPFCALRSQLKVNGIGWPSDTTFAIAWLTQHRLCQWNPAQINSWPLWCQKNIFQDILRQLESSRRLQVEAPTVPSAVNSVQIMPLQLISCHFICHHIMTYHVSLDFSNQLSVKSGGTGRVDQICLPRPSLTFRCQAEGKNIAARTKKMGHEFTLLEDYFFAIFGYFLTW
jgi:hypothetical protein